MTTIEYASSVTAEEAVALLVNITEVPAGRSVLDSTADALEHAANEYVRSAAHVERVENTEATAAVGAVFESLFMRIREEIARSRFDLASHLLDAFHQELKRPEVSLLVQVPSTSAVARFTIESVNLWATTHFGLHIPGLKKERKERLFYQVPDGASEEGEPQLPISEDVAEISDTKKGALKPSGLGRVAAEHLYVTMAYLTDAFVEKSGPGFKLGSGINVSKTATALSEYIAAEPSAKGLNGQSVEAIMTRMEDAQAVRQKKLKRL